MFGHPEGQKAASPSLQFERAEFPVESGRLSCAICSEPISSVYYQINQSVTCEKCKADRDLGWTQGSGFGRFFRALLYGVLAGMVGAGLWYAVRALTGFEVGLIAIVVGFLVGGAVKKGSNGRGGWRYQALAMFLTYGAIVSTYVPMIFRQLVEEAEKQQTTGGAKKAEKVASSAEATSKTNDPSSSIDSGSATSGTGSGKDTEPSVGQSLIAVALLAVFVLGVAFAAPFLMGWENAIALLIIAIGLYEAWKINRRATLEMSGPHRVGAPVPPPLPGTSV